jgi:putative hydrolase of the HAD superfamily
MNSSAPIQAITFDVGGTLIQPWPSVGHVYAEIAAAHGHRLMPMVLNQRFAKAWRGLTDFHHTRQQWSALVDETFAGLLPQPPSETFFDELYDRFAEPDAWNIFADTIPALEQLASQGMNLAVISNWDERLRPLLAKLDLAKYFKLIFVSCEIGFAKPSPVIFEEAARKLGVAAGSILHVGDSEECDAAGAAAAGFQWRLLRRGASQVKTGQISSLDELPVLLEL